MSSINYGRTAAQRKADHEGARKFELEVGTWLGDFVVENLDSTDRMDYWIPGPFIDVKEKNQPLSKVWPLPEGCRPEDAFILDELSIRRALEKYPHAYFILRDNPCDRTFLARVDEVVCGDRRRLDRIGPAPRNHPKGKWVVNLTQFRQLTDPKAEVLPLILQDQSGLAWRQSACLIPEGTMS